MTIVKATNARLREIANESGDTEAVEAAVAELERREHRGPGHPRVWNGRYIGDDAGYNVNGPTL